MGSGTVQTKTPSPVLAMPPGTGGVPQQTALAGRDVKTTPPDTFRQRLTRSFQQLGQRLSSLATALPGSSRSDTAGRSTRTQLVKLLDRLDSGDLDAAKLGIEFGRLAHEKRQWTQADPANADAKFGQMVRTLADQRWPGRNILHIEMAVGLTVTPAYGHLPEAHVREQLAALVTAHADDYRAVEGLKASHKNEIRKLGFDTARQIADGIFWKGGRLAAALKAFDKAEMGCEYKAGATKADLESARSALEEAGNQLLDALETTHPKQARQALAARYFATGNWRAIFARPRNRAQADLYGQFIDGYNLSTPPSQAAVVRKSEQAKALLTQVAQDEPRRLRGAQRTPETQYFRELRKQRRYLERVDVLAAPANDADTKTFRAALDRLPTSIRGPGKSADGDAPDFANALETLHEALAAADRKVAPMVANTLGQIQQLEKVSEVAERAEKAQQLVANTNDAVLMKLPVREQLALLKLLRGNLTRQPPTEPRWKPFLAAQSRLYMAMHLDPQFLRLEKQVRHEVVNELRKDKKMLQDARDLWHTYTPAQRRQVILKVAQVHSKALGCDPPRDVRFSTDPAVKGYQWRPHERVIVVGTTNRRFTDFEDMMDGVFHENSHNWQDQLVKDFRQLDPATRERNPLHAQALMFAANQPFYNDGTPDYHAYRMQPVEAHAYRTGMKLGAELMRMLSN